MRLRAGLVFSLAALLAGCGSGSSKNNDGGGGKGGGAGGAAGTTGPGGAAGTGTAGGAGATGTAGGGGATGTAGASAAGTGGGIGGAGGGAAGIGGATGGVGGAASTGGTSGAAGTGGAIVDGGSDAVCAPVDVPLAGVKSDILVLLDASASMNRDLTDMQCGAVGCGKASKWYQTTEAVNQVVAMTQANVNWGLKFFPDEGACGVSAGVPVPIGPGNAAAIQSAIALRTDTMGGLIGNGNTPTRAAEAAAAAYLSTITDPNPKFILLATDGLPTCPVTGNINTDDSIPAIGAVGDAYNAGIATFVLGIGALPTADATLSSLANAGGRPRAGYPTYYPVGSTAELVTALNQIVSTARVCRFLLTPPSGRSNDAIDVLTDGTLVPRDTSHGNGWDYTDGTHASIDLFGAPCDRIANGSTLRVSVTFRCPPAG